MKRKETIWRKKVHKKREGVKMSVDHTEIPLWGMRGSQGERNGRRKIKTERKGET